MKFNEKKLFNYLCILFLIVSIKTKNQTESSKQFESKFAHIEPCFLFHYFM